MKNKILILAMLSVFSANFIHSDEVEEVVVQASILNVTTDNIGDKDAMRFSDESFKSIFDGTSLHEAFVAGRVALGARAGVMQLMVLVRTCKYLCFFGTLSILE